MDLSFANDSTPASSSTTASKKRRTNVNKACENCRRRRVKCDGVRPSCGTCGVYKDECCWDPREDYRKPLSRTQVQALVMRVQDLERLLAEKGVDVDQGSEKLMSGATDVSEDDLKRDHHGRRARRSSGDPRDWSMDHLVEATGGLHLHGPTSAFRHLGKYPNESLSSLNIYADPPNYSHLPANFARYLPQTVILNEGAHDECISRFFKYYAPWCLRTDPLLFNQDFWLAKELPFLKCDHYSPLLHNAILSIALGFSDDPNLRKPSTRKVFADHAKSYIDEEGMNPSVATVQGLAHLASYHSVGAEHNLGWLYIGVALRCAMALGLNTDETRLLEKGQITEEQARARNTTFWTTFVQEGLWAPYIGRTIQLPEYTTKQPTIDTNLDQLIWEGIEGCELRPQPGMISTTFIQTVKLMRIGERIMHTLYGIKVDMLNLDHSGVVSDISLGLSTWLENLPPALALGHSDSPPNALPHILMMHLSHAWLVILLHRPFYRPLATLPGGQQPDDAATQKAAWAVKQCDKAAAQVIHLLRIWHRVHDLRLSPPTALQVCFIAGTTYVLSLASARSNSKRQAEATQGVNECIRLMRHIAVSWPAAEQAQLLLEGLWTDYGLSGLASAPRSPQATASVSIPDSASTWSDSGMWDQIMSHNNASFPDPSTLPVTVPAQGSYSESSLGLHATLADTDLGMSSNLGLSGGFDMSTEFTGFNDQLDRDTQALLDAILQPHLSVSLPAFGDHRRPM